MSDGAPVTVLCNGAMPPDREPNSPPPSTLDLNYLQQAGVKPVVHIGLPDFIRDVYHLLDRVSGPS